MKLYHPTKSIDENKFAKVDYGVKDYPAVTMNTIDVDMYVETAANGGDNNNNGLTPSTPKLDILDAQRNCPQINLGKLSIHVGEGSFLGAYVGRLINDSYPAVLPYGHVHIIGSNVLATLAAGDNTGIASGGGLDSSRQLAYFDKPLGSADYVVNELIGKTIKKLAGTGPNWSYVSSNSVDRVYLSKPFPLGFEIPNNTFEFEILDPGTIIDRAHPDVFGDATPTQIAYQLFFFSGKLEIENITFIPSIGPNALGIYNHNSTGDVIVRRCIFDSLINNYFLNAFTVAVSAGRLNIIDVLFNGVGKGTGNNNPIRGRKAGIVEVFNSVAINNRANIKVFDIVGSPSTYVTGFFADQGASLYRGIFFENNATFENILTENMTGDIFTSDIGTLSLQGKNWILDGGSYGVRAETSVEGNPRDAGNRINLTNATIKNMVNDGIVLSGGELSTAVLSGSSNGGYGVKLKNGARMVRGSSSIDISGSSGDVKVGDIDVNHSDLILSEDFVTDLGSLCRYGRR